MHNTFGISSETIDKINEAFQQCAVALRDAAQTVCEALSDIDIESAIHESGSIILWGIVCRPKLHHLARHGKNERIRKKNRRRLIREYWRWKHSD